MAVTGAPVEVIGLVELVAELKGPMFRDINNQLRYEALDIAEDLVPVVQGIVRDSGAPQAAAFVPTVRAKRDRVPVVAVGAINPRLRKFTRRGAGPAASRQRRGSMAHGILFGPKGGHRKTSADENYYRLPRRDGYLAGALAEHGAITRRAVDLYLEAYVHVLRSNGWGQAVKRGR